MPLSPLNQYDYCSLFSEQELISNEIAGNNQIIDTNVDHIVSNTVYWMVAPCDQTIIHGRKSM